MINSSLAKWIQYMRQKMPTQASLFASPWFKPFARWFDRPYYWQLNRERAASAVAVGMFCGLMPGPTQMLTALIVAYLIRTHLPVALLTTLYTNPLTYTPYITVLIRLVRAYYMVSGAKPCLNCQSLD